MSLNCPPVVESEMLMYHNIVMAILLVLGLPVGMFMFYDAIIMRTRPTTLATYDYWVCLGGTFTILLLEAWGLRFLLRGQFRSKREIKITAFVITAFVFLIWQASVFIDFGHQWQNGVWAYLANGCFEFGIHRSGRPINWTTILELPADAPFISWDRINWWPYIWWSKTGVWSAIRIPLWAVHIATLIPTLILFWRHRKIPIGYCPQCSYNLTGNTSGVCPECGKAVNGSCDTSSPTGSSETPTIQ